MPPAKPTALAAASGLHFPVVGLGASAGGLAALSKLLESLPASPGMAFVVILHLSPAHESSAAEILQKVTRMTVTKVASAARIERDHVYVIPPSRGLSMVDGHLSLTELERDRGRHIVIDLFFRTLAQAHRERAVAVVLSGSGADGSVGIGEIKEQGGIVIAQSPVDAEFDGMPGSAIATGKVDVVLPVAEIGQKLLDIWQNAQRIELPDPEKVGPQIHPPASPEMAEKSLRRIMEILHARTGHDFKHYKRATVLRRIERRLQVNSLPHLTAYERYLEKHSHETPLLLGDMLIGVTNFFRDREAFEALERTVIPALFDQALDGQQLRAWVAGCSTGEEAYTLLMLISQELASAPHKRPIQVFATDIDEAAIARAREGRYPESIITDIPPAMMRRYMSRDAGQYLVHKPLRSSVLFAQHNILRDPPFSKLDLISCRNLLIYLDREVQREILQMFHFGLRPGGYLFLGSSETAEAAGRLFSVLDKRHRIYQANSTMRATRTLPRFPLGGVAQKSLPLAAEPSPRLGASLGDVHQQVLLEFAPPSVIVKGDGEILTKIEETAEINDDLQNLISSSGIATIFVDRDMRIKRFTPAATRVFNIIAGDVGRSLLDITHKLDYAGLADDAMATFHSLRPVEREVPGNDDRWYLARMLPYRTGEDRIDGAVLTFIDITTRRSAERRVDIDRERMHLIAASMPDVAILTADESGHLTSWSSGAERLFGFTEAELLGKPIDIIFTPEDREAGAPQAEMRTARQEGRALDERWHLRKDGSRIFVSGIMAPMRLGRLEGYAKIARDMTDRQQEETTRSLALNTAVSAATHATEASQLKDEFLAVMSHELKHPLNLIQLNAQLLVSLPEVKDLPSVRKIGRTIQQTVRSQARIIDDLLDISRMRTGKLVLNVSLLDLAKALHDSLNWAARQAKEKGVGFSVEPAGEPLLVRADPVRIEQVALNLLSNAVKFTPPRGHIAVRVAKDGDAALIEVADSGRGIAPDWMSSARWPLASAAF